MKKLTELKIYVTSYFNNLSRERIAIFICIPIAVVALCICATMLLITDSKNNGKSNESLEEIPTAQITEQIPLYPPDSPYSLEFESLGEGRCAILGIGNFEEKELKIPQKSPNGETIVEIRANAFKNCEFIEMISLPSTIEKIGDNAFKGCVSLIYIDVDMNNESFASVSGVLFSKNRNRLIFYPPNKADEKYYLTANVKTIDDYAFEDAKNLKVILYPKSTADFEAITIGKGNDILLSLPITCNYVSSNNSK